MVKAFAGGVWLANLYCYFWSPRNRLKELRWLLELRCLRCGRVWVSRLRAHGRRHWGVLFEARVCGMLDRVQ